VATRVIAFANQKGGVGKTTSAVNTAAALAAKKQKCLLLDLDPQGNATAGCGVSKKTLALSIHEMLAGEAGLAEVVHDLPDLGFSLVPANADLTGSEVGLLRMSKREYILSSRLAKQTNDYDFVLIDCPPSLNMLTLNALVAADGVIIPTQCEYYAMEGLSSLLATITQVQKRLNAKLIIDGILRTMYDSRNRLAHDVSAQLVQHFKGKLFKTTIPRNTRLAEAPSYGVPGLFYDRDSSGARAYIALAQEVLRKKKKLAKQSSLQTETV